MIQFPIFVGLTIENLYPIPYTLYFKTELNIQMFNGTSLFCKEHNIIDNPANVK